MSVNGFAIRHAARLLKQKILEAATSPSGKTQRGSFPPAFPGRKPHDLDIKESVIYVKAEPSERLSLAEFVRPAGSAGALCYSPSSVMERRFAISRYRSLLTVGTSKRALIQTIGLRFCRQAHFMEVEVDTETGEVIVTKVVNVNDVGKVISWEGCEGQQYGGTYMGVGRGLFEEVVHDPVTGVMLNGNLLDYKIATMNDAGQIVTELVETGMGYGPYGLVGIGEDVATVVPALVGPAVHNAIGAWVDDFPVTPSVVLKALGKT